MHSLFYTQWEKVTGKTVDKSQICEIIFDFFLFSTLVASFGSRL